MLKRVDWRQLRNVTRRAAVAPGRLFVLTASFCLTALHRYTINTIISDDILRARYTPGSAPIGGTSTTKPEELVGDRERA